MPNTELLQRTLTEIETHPDQWDQTTYRQCFAAVAVRLSGGQWADDKAIATLVPVPDDPEGDILHGTVLVPDRAARLLDLGTTWEMNLFYSGNTLDDLRRIVGAIVRETEMFADA